MNEQITSQEMKLTLLQKKVDNISVLMSDVSKTLSSLEGKINEDKERDFEAFLKGKRKKLTQSLTHLKVPGKETGEEKKEKNYQKWTENVLFHYSAYCKERYIFHNFVNLLKGRLMIGASSLNTESSTIKLSVLML